jgi:hypothetical protein
VPRGTAGTGATATSRCDITHLDARMTSARVTITHRARRCPGRTFVTAVAELVACPVGARVVLPRTRRGRARRLRRSGSPLRPLGPADSHARRSEAGTRQVSPARTARRCAAADDRRLSSGGLRFRQPGDDRAPGTTRRTARRCTCRQTRTRASRGRETERGLRERWTTEGCRSCGSVGVTRSSREARWRS